MFKGFQMIAKHYHRHANLFSILAFVFKTAVKLDRDTSILSVYQTIGMKPWLFFVFQRQLLVFFYENTTFRESLSDPLK